VYFSEWAIEQSAHDEVLQAKWASTVDTHSITRCSKRSLARLPLVPRVVPHLWLGEVPSVLGGVLICQRSVKNILHGGERSSCSTPKVLRRWVHGYSLKKAWCDSE
jgi:hypothetical protein